MRPNFVFILADDLGYADLGCYGGRTPCSPELDRLAADGLRFTDGYSNSPVCSPTRFALMTGRFQYRLRGGNDEPIASRHRGNAVLGLPPDHPTLPSLLRDAGYTTALVGKWHLGFLPHFGPLKSGYGEFFGPMSGGLDYFTHRDSAGQHDLFEGEAEAHPVGYLTDLISERAVDFIGRQRGSQAPFLLSVHYTAPHWPWETRDDEAVARGLEKISHTDGGSVQTYLDDGPPHGRGHRPHPRRARRDRRGGQYARGLHQRQRRRALLRHLAAGGQEDGPARGRHPRALHRPLARARAAGAAPPPSSRSRWTGWRPSSRRRAWRRTPTTRSTASASCRCWTTRARRIERELYWRMKFRNQKAMRSGDWKYLSLDGDEFLFDLSADQRERANRGRREPERLAAMRARYAAWEATMPPLPADATFSIPYTKADLAQPS